MRKKYKYPRNRIYLHNRISDMILDCFDPSAFGEEFDEYVSNAVEDASGRVKRFIQNNYRRRRK